MSNNVLYISYDGMTDNLGQSQVLPYVVGLANKGYDFTLVSFEKPDRYKTYKDEIETICVTNGIKWVPLKFTASPPIISKIKDLFILKRTVKKLYKLHSFKMVHCRSYVSAGMGLWLKQKYGVKFLFDIRGFWVDERVDGGIWNLKNPFYKILYHYYKRREVEFFNYADHIVTLTKASIPYLNEHQNVNENKISIIPCATDFNLFKIATINERQQTRSALGISSHNLVISYLGSLGTWYLLDKMLLFFEQLQNKYPNSVFLFITPESPEIIINQLKELGLPSNNFIFHKARRAEVSQILSASDISLYFIKQCFSKISSSPTKLGEILATGIPVITNSKIGDTNDLIKKELNGIVIDDFTNESFQSAINQVEQLLQLDNQAIRYNAKNIYHLDSALQSYLSCYQKLLG